MLAFLAALVVASACAFGDIFENFGEPVDMRTADIVGTWVNDQHQSTITFRDDGTFSATGLPHRTFDYFLPPDFDSARRIDGRGTWSLERPSGTPDVARNGVDMRFSWLAGEEAALGMQMDAYRQHGRVVLLLDFSDAYRKCEPNCRMRIGST